MFKRLGNKISYVVDGKELAYVTYPFIMENVVEINHTVVDESLQGQGIASRLLNEAYLDICEHNYKAKLSCSYAIKWFERHPECSDVLSRWLYGYKF